MANLVLRNRNGKYIGPVARVRVTIPERRDPDGYVWAPFGIRLTLRSDGKILASVQHSDGRFGGHTVRWTLLPGPDYSTRESAEALLLRVAARKYHGCEAHTESF